MRYSLNVSVIYVSLIALMFSQTMPAYAGLIGTEQFMDQQLVELDRETIRSVLNRDEARTLLEKHGVSKERAHERIDALTDEEVRVVAQKFEELPAAGSGILLGILVVVLVFIILDLAKVTNVFKSI